MTALLLENLKLIMLFLLIGSIIGLSHLMARMPSRRAASGCAATAGRRRPASKGGKMSVIAHGKT